MLNSKRLLSALALAAAGATAGCAQPGLAPATGAVQALARPDLSPPDCKGQQTEKRYATLTGTLATNGGSFCIPAFGGFGGSVRYPSVNPSVSLTLTTNVRDYNHQPKLGSGKPLVYLQFAISGATQFGTNVKSRGGLTGAKIVAGQQYTAVGQVTIDHYTFELGPCFTTAKKGKYGGVVGGLGSLVKGQDIPAAAGGVIEIYSGRQAGSQC
jgi:hypothetical protein